MAEFKEPFGSAGRYTSTSNPRIRIYERITEEPVVKGLSNMTSNMTPNGAQSERQKQLADVEGRMRAMCGMSTATNVEFCEVECEVREQLWKLAELVEGYQAEMRALTRAVFPEGLTVIRLQETGDRGVRVEGIAQGNSPTIIVS